MKFHQLLESSDSQVLKKAKELIRILTSEMGAQVRSVEVEEGILTIAISGTKQAKVSDVSSVMKPEFSAVRCDRASQGTDWHFKFPENIDHEKLEDDLNK